MTTRIHTVLLAALGIALLAGCATTNLPPEEIAAPKGKIAAAEEAGATEDPQAALHLTLAHDQFERASKLLATGDNERASRWLARADADAELALELAHLERTRANARDAVRSIQTLREEHDLITQ